MKYIDPSFKLIELPLLEKIELAGRVCYQSEDKKKEGVDIAFIQNICKRGHTSVLEHGGVYFTVSGIEKINLQNNLLQLEEKYMIDLLPYIKFKRISPIHIIGSTNLRLLHTLSFYVEKSWGIKNFLTGIIQEFPELNPFLTFEKVINCTSTVKSFLGNPEELTIETFNITTDRGILGELTRHRTMSFSAESTRYCVSGDTTLSYKNAHNKQTIQELFDNPKNGFWKRLLVKNINEETGEIIYSKIKNIFCNGIKKVYEITTELGYTLKCTKDHEIYTPLGYKKLLELKKGDFIYVNGVEINKTEQYKNYDWLYYQNITLNKTFVQISKEFNYGVSVLKAWGTKLGIPKKGTGYFNIGIIPWNKGLNEDHPKVKIQADALRKYHCNYNDRGVSIKKENTSKYQKHIKDNCEICNSMENLEVHHKDKTRDNHFPENLITLCESCHMRVHSQNLTIIHGDKIISIVELGEEKVYDLEMDGFSNYVANGIVVHNCSYNKNKFNNEISIITPETMIDCSFGELIYYDGCVAAEIEYFSLLEAGCTAQIARKALPLGLKTEFYMSGYVYNWNKVFRLRSVSGAHPEVRVISQGINQTLNKKYGDLSPLI